MNLFLNGFSCVRKAMPHSFSPGTLYPICLQEETDKKRKFWSFVETSGSDQDGITRTGCVLLPEASKIMKTNKCWSRKWQPPPVVLPGSPMDRGAWWSCLWVSSVSLLYSSVAASLPWFYLFLAPPVDMWDPIYLTRDQTQVPCIGSMESQSLDHQRNPQSFHYYGFAIWLIFGRASPLLFPL